MLLPLLDNLCFVIFVSNLPPYAIPCHSAIHLLPSALIYPLRARIPFTVACIYPFFCILHGGFSYGSELSLFIHICTRRVSII